MEIPEGNRKLWVSLAGILALLMLGMTALITKTATFDQVFTPLSTMVSAIVGAFITGNLIETKMKKNGNGAPPSLPAGGGR